MQQSKEKQLAHDIKHKQTRSLAVALAHLDDGSVTRLDGLGGVFELLARTTVDLLNELLELAGNVGSVAVEHGAVAGTDLTRVVKNDNLSHERGGFLGRVVLGVRGDVTTTDFLDRDVLDVEADVVAGEGLGERFVVHLR